MRLWTKFWKRGIILRLNFVGLSPLLYAGEFLLFVFTLRSAGFSVMAVLLVPAAGPGRNSRPGRSRWVGPAAAPDTPASTAPRTASRTAPHPHRYDNSRNSRVTLKARDRSDDYNSALHRHLQVCLQTSLTPPSPPAVKWNAAATSFPCSLRPESCLSNGRAADVSECFRNQSRISWQGALWCTEKTYDLFLRSLPRHSREDFQLKLTADGRCSVWWSRKAWRWREERLGVPRGESETDCFQRPRSDPQRKMSTMSP